MQGLESVGRAVRRELRDDRGKIFVAISAGWFLSFGVRMAYPVVLPFVRADYGLSLTVAGFLLTLLWAAYAIGQLPGGLMGDRVGEGTTMTVSIALTGGTIALIVLWESATVLFVGTVLLGGSVALFGVVRLTALADVYPDRVGTAHGLLGAVGDVGNTVLPPAVGILAAATVWQFGFGILVPIFLLVASLLWLVVPNRTSPAAPSQSISLEFGRDVLADLRRPSLVFATTIQIFGLMIFQSFTGFYPTYLIEVKELSAAVASGLFALVFVFGIGFRPLAGTAYDRFGARRSLLVFVSLSGFGFVLLPIIDGLFGLVLVTILLAFTGARGTIVLAYMTLSLSETTQNTGLGIVRTIFFAFGAVSPVAFGAIADRGFFDEGFLLLAGLSAVILVIVLRLPHVER